jgi:tRNA dimethylallyltransferase
LCERIEARVDAMFRDGLLEEVRSLQATGQQLGPTARQALGYRESLAHLAGERDLAATIALVKTRTRQFAKRQATWFRSLSELRTLALEEPFDAQESADRIVALLERR